MSKNSILFLFAFGVLYLAGCTTKVHCDDQSTYVVLCSFNRTIDTATDKYVNAVAYSKGSDFSTPIDTIYDVSAGLDTRAIIFLDKIMSGCDQYDWQFVFYKTGEVFKLKNITHHDRSEKQDNQDTHACGKDLSYIANDVYNYEKGNDGQDAQGITIHINQ